MSDLSFEEINPSYDDETKPFPNQDEYFLGTTLGLEVDSVSHIRQIGMLDKEKIENLRKDCIQSMTEELRFYAGWDVGKNDHNQHPNGKEAIRCVAKWKSLGINQDKSFVEELIPNKQAIKGLDTTYLICDFVGFHDDIQLSEEKNRGLLIALVQAPYGCKFVTNEKHETIAEVGGIYLIDDLYRHGVFPTKKGPIIDAARMHKNESTDYREEIANNTAMCFVLLAHYYDDQYKVNS